MGKLSDRCKTVLCMPDIFSIITFVSMASALLVPLFRDVYLNFVDTMASPEVEGEGS